MTLRFLLFVLLLATIIPLFNQFEHFSESPLLIWKTSVNITPLYLIWNESYDNPWKNTVANIKNLQFVVSDSILPQANLLTLIDAYSFAKNINNKKILTVIPEKSSLFFLKPRGQLIDLNLVDIINTNQVIGYTSQYQRELIEIVALSLSIKKSVLKLKQINQNSIINNDFFNANMIDVLSMFTPINNPQLQQKFDSNFIIDFIDYSNIDIDLLKYYFPPALLNNISLDIYFPSYQTKFPIKKILDIDLLLIGGESLDNNLDLRSQLFELIVAADNYGVNNLYNIWFPIFSHTQQYLSKKNAYTGNRDNLTILEQFQSGNHYFEYTPSINVNGYYDSTTEKLRLNSNIVLGVPLQQNWKIILQNQNRSEENGEYFVESDSILKKVLILGLASDEFTVNNNVLTPKKTIISIEHIPWDKLTTNNKLFIPSIKRTGYRSGNNIILDIESKADIDENWSCTDPNIKIKGLCISKYDINGQPKKNLTYWDKPCTLHSQCPYYQANKNYKNYNGGCNSNGYCQLPVGMKRIAYRMYDSNFKPLCYGCHGVNNGDCCADQENREKYLHLQSPDYAYPLDFFERLSS